VVSVAGWADRVVDNQTLEDADKGQRGEPPSRENAPKEQESGCQEEELDQGTQMGKRWED
jgi:hypothetical protein